MSSCGGSDVTYAEPEPAAAAAVFGPRIAQARAYAQLLCTDGVLRGVIGPREPGRIWRRHLLNAAALADYVPHGANVTDVGSGAGLPGIPLLLARPDLRVTLVEPLARRVRFLTDVRARLELDDLEISQVRAQERPRGQADVVVARAVAPLDKLLDLALPLLRPGGLLLAQKGSAAAAEVAAAQPSTTQRGIAEMSLERLATDDETYLVRVVTVDEPVRLSARRSGSSGSGGSGSSSTGSRRPKGVR